MAVLKHRFFYHENGSHDERWHYLARDTETERVFVINGYAPMGQEYHETQSEVADFLATNNGTAQRNLMQLIGTLVQEV